jgi:hypothetical protein
MHHLGRDGKLWLIAGTFLATTCAIQSARANEPPADLCSLLPASEVSKTLGRAYDSPQESVAPRPYRNTAQGTDCSYRSTDGSRLLFRAYVDPSPSAAAELFDRLAKFFGAQTPIAGLGDQAYLDGEHGLHVRKGKVRFFISLDSRGPFTQVRAKQLEDLAGRVAAQL